MVKKSKGESCCSPSGSNIGCCRVESLITVDERGQMVLPKEIREKANIRAGDKLAVISMEKKGKICCISLIKSDELVEMVNELLGPVMKDIFKTGGKK